MNILIFGGTFEAVELANALVERGHKVTTSLAGRTGEPKKPAGKLVMGGMGGADGIVAYLSEHKVEHVIDATHPFAQGISGHILAATTRAGIPLIRFVRPPFDEPDDSAWWRVDSAEEAAEKLPIGATVFLTLGRQTLDPFLQRKDAHYVLRAIEKPEADLPDNFSVVLARPPFSRAEELSLMRRERITHLIAKDSGGEMTSAKLEAAFMLNIQIIMINRPTQPDAPSVHTIADVLAVFDHLPAASPPLWRRFFLP